MVILDVFHEQVHFLWVKKWFDIYYNISRIMILSCISGRLYTHIKIVKSNTLLQQIFIVYYKNSSTFYLSNVILLNLYSHPLSNTYVSWFGPNLILSKSLLIVSITLIKLDGSTVTVPFIVI